MGLIAPPTTYAMSGPTPKASAMINSKAGAVKLNTLNKTAGGKRRRRRGGGSIVVVKPAPAPPPPLLSVATVHAPYTAVSPVNTNSVTTANAINSANSTALSAFDKDAAPATMPVKGGSRKGRKTRKSRKGRKSRKSRKTRRHRK